MWKTVKLGDVCDFQNGFAFKSSLFKENGSPILRISNIQQDKIDMKNLVYFSEHDYNLDFSRYRVEQGDLLIAMSGATTGKLGFNSTNRIFYMNQRVGKFATKENLDKKYLYYLLSTKVEENLSISKGAAQPNLSTEQIKNIEFLLPPLPEQKRIVAKLDKVFAEIDRAVEVTEDCIRQQKLLLQKVIDEKTNYQGDAAAQWDIGSLCSIKHGFAFKSADFSKSDDEELPIVLTPGNFQEDGTLCFSQWNTKRCTSEYDDDLEFPLGSLVVVMTDLSSQMKLLGKPAFITQPKVLHNQRIGLVRNDEQTVSNRYLYYFFKSTAYLNEIRRTATGTMVRHTAPKRILATKLSAPSSLSRQQKLCEEIGQAEELISENVRARVKQLEELAALKSAILAQELQPPQSEAA